MSEIIQCDRCFEAIEETTVCWAEDGVPLCFDCFFELSTEAQPIKDLFPWIGSKNDE